MTKVEAERAAAEARRRESPEYCIENDLELPAAAFREVVKELTCVKEGEVKSAARFTRVYGIILIIFLVSESEDKTNDGKTIRREGGRGEVVSVLGGKRVFPR